MPRLVTSVLLATALAASVAHADSLGDVRTGNAAFGDGRYEAAVEAFSRAIRAGDLDPEALAITFNNRGVAYSELGDYDRAIADYDQALALLPADTTAIRNLRIAHIRRAAALSRLGDRAAAVADYDRAIALEPQHPLAYLRRGQLALERGDRAAAIADLTRARELDPDNPDIAALLDDARRTDAATATTPPEVSPTAAAAAESDYAIDPPGQPPSVAAPPPRTAAMQPVITGGGQTYRAVADVNVRAGPGNAYPRIAGIKQGASVEVVAERQGWLQLNLDDGGSGWVYRRRLQPTGQP